ncbi:MAG: GrpB family protein [Marmoricola sp.]|nr:GrpB family protein [Marmoricola sp.]
MSPTPEEITRHHDSAPPEGRSAWVPGKRPRTGIAVVEPDPAWPWAYAQLEDRIRAALGVDALVVEHVGSTAVPGLPAKPVIDVDLTVADPADEDAWLPRLEAEGFELVIREPWWHEHRCLVHHDPRCNLHVFGPDSPEPIRHRLFRDWLIGHPEGRDRYRDAKLGAATEANAAGEHVMDYNARKEPVVREIYDRAFRAAGLLRE